MSMLIIHLVREDEQTNNLAFVTKNFVSMFCLNNYSLLIIHYSLFER